MAQIKMLTVRHYSLRHAEVYAQRRRQRDLQTHRQENKAQLA